MNKNSLFLKKQIKDVHEDLPDERGHVLKRHLKSVHLIAIGIGAIIGAGIFVITGQAAALYAGPSIALSFLFASLICVLAGLCYSELSSLIPVSGGSYSYSYVAMGEFPAWIVGWALMMMLTATASTVAVGWSGYFVNFMHDFGLHLPPSLTQAPFAHTAAVGLHKTGAILNIPAVCLVALLAVFISIGIKAASYFNNVMVVIKLTTIVLFIIVGIPFINTENWVPFVPENQGHFGEFGISGIFRGSGLVFFAYVGFDAISTLAQDTVNPQKNVPRGILGSLTICTIAYIVTSLVLTGVVSYTLLNVPDPIALALNAFGPKLFWLNFIVKIAILAGLASVVLVQMLGLTRIFFAMGTDGLLPRPFRLLHPKFKVPVFASAVTGLISLSIAALFPVDFLGQLVSITSLFLFVIVCLGVLILRYTHPEVHRPFKVPFAPYVPILGITACLLQMLCLPLISWIQLFGWLILGLAVYFTYGFKHSQLRIEVEKHHRKLNDTLY